ncbi:MAG: hypothetical protein EOQ39_03725 [Mesorhizobium sp.]|uniref:hypothetical protein n=1 Tax=Mesorhizobium sp. TaxID=1871066 RepID=UPI000FE94490|nr:hypothetical protein [Mesorhizobium sp.]RWB09019.1 MAG: hypothetical protein EOQ37_05880 [Mesorhizobium sp.]RWB17440.1 MAG: hypothetical protein EOQ39_03725 [Mesorhizobium sp.]
MANVQFKIADISRAIKGASKGGMQVGRAEIDPATGKIIIIAATQSSEPENAVDKWMRDHARSS